MSLLLNIYESDEHNKPLDDFTLQRYCDLVDENKRLQEDNKKKQSEINKLSRVI